jgi:hypothetical protein
MGGFRTAGKALFGGWEPKRCCRAPHREDREASFSVYRNEREEWRFKDFGSDEHGGLVGFVMLAGMDEKQASRWLMEQAGVRPANRFGARSERGQRNQWNNEGGGRGAGGKGGFGGHGRRRRLPGNSEGIREESASGEPERLPEIGAAASEAWKEGVDHFKRSRERVGALATFRGWPEAWAQHLVDARAISMPLYHGRRTVAFLVEAPDGARGGMTMRRLGFHCRLRLRRDLTKASWRFVPNATEHGQSTPSLPFILGGSAFDAARLLVITGGQWDALTFAFAAGWLGKGCPWPKGVCVLGIRGDSSTNVFLRHYAPFWPPSANCLLLPDFDASGGKWLGGGDSFIHRLSARCRKVAVVKCAPHKDFNDFYRAARVTPREMTELLATHGMALEEEAAI